MAIHRVLIEGNQNIELVTETENRGIAGAKREENVAAANNRLVRIIGVQVQPPPHEYPRQDIAGCGDSLVRGGIHQPFGPLGSLSDLTDALLGKIHESDVGRHANLPSLEPFKEKSQSTLAENRKSNRLIILFPPRGAYVAPRSGASSRADVSKMREA